MRSRASATRSRAASLRMVRCCQGLSAARVGWRRLGRRAAVVAGDVGDDLDLALVEGVEHGVGDQVVGVLVVPLVVDRVADVVEEGGVLQPLPLARAEAVERGGDVEQAQRRGGRSAGCAGRRSRCARRAGAPGGGAGPRARGPAGIGWPRAASTSPSRSARSQTWKRSTPGVGDELLEQHGAGEQAVGARAADRRQRRRSAGASGGAGARSAPARSLSAHLAQAADTSFAGRGRRSGRPGRRSRPQCRRWRRAARPGRWAPPRPQALVDPAAQPVERGGARAGRL